MLTEHYRQLGRSELSVSPIALGTVKLGRNTDVKYPAGFELPRDRDVTSLLSRARELGVNLIDTAPAYGTSEERLGNLIDHRQDWLICTKAGEHYSDSGSRFDFSFKGITRSLDESLARLRTDYLDLVLIHSDGQDLEILRKGEAIEALSRAKEAGKIRCTGMSTKTMEGGLAAIDHVDVLMVTLNTDDQSQRNVINAAQDSGVGILIKKAFASGHAEPKESLELVLREPGVSSVVAGTINPVHLEENVLLAATILTDP